MSLNQAENARISASTSETGARDKIREGREKENEELERETGTYGDII